jgi:hypothetical protein
MALVTLDSPSIAIFPFREPEVFDFAMLAKLAPSGEFGGRNAYLSAGPRAGERNAPGAGFAASLLRPDPFLIGGKCCLLASVRIIQSIFWSFWDHGNGGLRRRVILQTLRTATANSQSNLGAKQALPHPGGEHCVTLHRSTKNSCRRLTAIPENVGSLSYSFNRNLIVITV